MSVLRYAWALGYFGSYVRTRRRHLLRQTETVQEKIAASTAAFASEGVDLDGATLLQIERLLGEVKKASAANDDVAFRKLVNFNRLMAYIKQNACAANESALALFGLKLQISTSAAVELGWQRIILRHVTPVAGTDQYILYTHCYDENDSETDMRFWVTNEAGEWKIADWERLDLGMRQSTEWALCLAYAEDPRIDEYFQALDDVYRAGELTDEDEEGQAEMLLRGAASRQFPPELRDHMWVILGYHWNQLSRADDAIRCLDQVQTPAATPGVYFGKAIALAEKQQFAEAIEALSSYEAVVGAVPDASRLKAGWLGRLERYGEEIEEWKKVLRGEPDDSEALLSLARLLDESELDLITRYLASRKDPLAQVESLADLFPGRYNTAGLGMLERYVAATAPRSATAAYVAGVRLRDADQLEAAAAQFRQAMEVAVDDDARSRNRVQYLQAMMEAGRVLEAYQAVDDQPQALAYLLGDYDSDYEEGGAELTEDEIAALLAAHGEQHPDDPLGAYLRGIRLREQGQYAEAATELREAVKLGGEDEWLAERSGSELQTVLVRSGRPLDAYQPDPSLGTRFVSEVPNSRFATLASLCRTYHRWDELRALMDEHQVQHPDDPGLQLCHAVLLIQEEKIDDARVVLETVVRNIDGLTEEYRIYDEISELMTHARLWEAAYRQAAGTEGESVLFENFATAFAAEGRYNDLRSLLAKHRQQVPDDLDAASWDELLLETDEDRAGYVDAWLPLCDRYFEEDHIQWRRPGFAESLVRTSLRIGRADDALQVATRVKERQQELLPLILCHATAGRVAETCSLIEEYLDDYGSMFMLYDDPSIGQLLRSPKFSELHARHPVEIPMSISENATILLLAQSPNWDESKLDEMLNGLGESLQVTRMPSDGVEPRFAVAVGDARVLVSVHTGRYLSDRSLNVHTVPEQHDAVLKSHTAWVSVDGIRSARPKGKDDCRTVVRDVALRLLDDNCQALWLVDGSRLLRNSENDRAAWLSAATKTDFAQLGEYLDIRGGAEGGDVVGHRAADACHAATATRPSCENGRRPVRALR